MQALAILGAVVLTVLVLIGGVRFIKWVVAGLTPQQQKDNAE